MTWADDRLVRHEQGRPVYERLARTSTSRSGLICWMDGNDSGFSTTTTVSCGAVAVLEGSLREERLVLEGPPAARSVGPGGSFTFGPPDIHRTRHEGDAPALTIHAYSPPLRGTGVYAVDGEGGLRRRPTPSGDELRAAATA